MDILEALNKIHDHTECCLGVAIAAMDGIIVEVVGCVDEEANQDIDFELLAAEYSSMLCTAQEKFSEFEAGQVNEFSILSGEISLILMPVTDEYFIIMAMKSTGIYGKGRYMMKKYLPVIRNDL